MVPPEQIPFTVFRLHGSDTRVRVDTFDIEIVNKFKWCLDNSTIKSVTDTSVSLPHYILNVMKGKQIEYVDGNIFNNSRSNIIPRTKYEYEDIINKRQAIERDSLHWNSDKKYLCVHSVVQVYRDGFSKDVPWSQWTPKNRIAHQLYRETDVVIPYKGDVKDRYDKLMEMYAV